MTACYATGVMHLHLGGVTRLNVAGRRGPHDAFVFDPHRLALGCWALALDEAHASRPATLVTLDRHFDLVVPKDLSAIPDRSAGVRALDEYARWSLDVRNTDHVIAAMNAGLVGDALVLARAHPAGAFAGDVYRDRHGAEHHIISAPNIAQALDGANGAAARLLLSNGAPLLLDVDLDCFTTPSDADPTSVVPWTPELIRDFLLPQGAGAFWDAISGALCLTIAREPYHCGGLVEAGRLFERAAQVLFTELLGADLP